MLIPVMPVNDVRTVSDTKRAFYTLYTRPVTSIYRRVVEELMVEMHLLAVNADFQYNPIYALGVVTTYDRFMQGYRPETDKTSIFNALFQALGYDPQTYRHDAEQLMTDVSHLSIESLLSQLTQLENANGNLFESLKAIAENPKFKYNRLFAIGLYSLLEKIDADLVKDEKQRIEILQKLSEPLKLNADKLQKDLELYRSNLEKITQAQIVLEDILKADRKKKEDREKAKDATSG